MRNFYSISFEVNYFIFLDPYQTQCDEKELEEGAKPDQDYVMVNITDLFRAKNNSKRPHK